MMVISEDVVKMVAADIGTDAAYYRKEKDRLYLTGIEIALLIGTGVLTSFFLGVFEGIKKGLHKHGEQIGESMVDKSIEKLKSLRGDVAQIDTHEEHKISGQLKYIYTQIDEIVGSPNILEIAKNEDNNIHDLEVNQVARYLEEIGFPKEDTTQRSVIIVRRIRQEIMLVEE